MRNPQNETKSAVAINQSRYANQVEMIAIRFPGNQDQVRFDVTKLDQEGPQPPTF